MNFDFSLPTLFLQAVVDSPVPRNPGLSPLSIFLMLIPVVMIIAGTVLGFHALRDIRLASGRLGGPVLATLAAGLLPAIVVVIACAAAVNELMEAMVPPGRRRDELWIPVGCALGLWLSFLMLRGMYRQATEWVRPASARAAMSRTATAALILTILGGLLIFTYISRPDFVRVLGEWTPKEMVFVNLVVLTAGLICGVIARAETTGKICAWICGGLFLFLVLAHS